MQLDTDDNDLRSMLADLEPLLSVYVLARMPPECTPHLPLREEKRRRAEMFQHEVLPLLEGARGAAHSEDIFAET